MNGAVTFGGGNLDRSAHFRADKARISALQDGPNTRFVPFWRGKVMVSGESDLHLGWVEQSHSVMADADPEMVFLGFSDNIPYFAADITRWEPPLEDAGDLHGFTDHTRQVHPGFADCETFAELRLVMARLSPQDAEIAATGKALLTWHHTHGFCARCGVKSVMANAGWQRRCDACQRFHFPRTDPVVIMLICDGNDLMLGRSHGWPEGMYSLLAGFIEPGETIEHAVMREVLEETGVQTRDVEYLTSQPWPFPASLMIGCRAEAVTRHITVDPDELDDARWVSREDLAEAMIGRNPEIQPARQGSIARHIMQNWLADTLPHYTTKG